MSCRHRSPAPCAPAPPALPPASWLLHLSWRCRPSVSKQCRVATPPDPSHAALPTAPPPHTPPPPRSPLGSLAAHFGGGTSPGASPASSSVSSLFDSAGVPRVASMPNLHFQAVNSYAATADSAAAAASRLAGGGGGGRKKDDMPPRSHSTSELAGECGRELLVQLAP